MADKEKKGGVNIIRAVGFGLMGAFLVVMGYAGRGLTDDFQSYDSVPQHWLGPTFTGRVVAYNENKDLTLHSGEEDWTCTIEDRTVVTASGEVKELTEGALVQVKFRGGKTPIAKNIRILEGPDGATPVSSASPTAAAPTPTPTTSP